MWKENFYHVLHESSRVWRSGGGREERREGERPEVGGKEGREGGKRRGGQLMGRQAPRDPGLVGCRLSV